MEKIGRFAYIEPNDILDTANNTTHPYENYSIDVELEVSLPRRGVWVNSINKKGSVAVDRSGKNDNNGNIISFFGGEDGYLTSNPGSLIYKDILNSKQDRESLGITNIHISYNSYFYPQVTIKFTDIRGMGLMMPHEEVYRQEQTNTKDNNGKMTEKFFAALFSFPYPEFKLRVKGFYGKKVEYSLVVEDFKSNFNNQTGNFEATVKFIGKMYGIYTDIPMAHLLIAPYCKYGGNGETTIWDELSLTFPDNPSVRIPTLIKLKETILTATNELKSNMSSNMNSELIKLSEKDNCLSDLKIAYKALFKYQFKESDNDIIRKDNVILLPHSDNVSNKNYSYLSGETKFIETLVELCNKINDYNSKFDNQISTIKPFSSSENCYIPANESYILKFSKNGEEIKVETKDVLSNFCENFNGSKYNDLSKILSYKLNSNGINNRSYFVIDCNDLYQNIEKIEENIKNKIVEQNKELNKQITEDLTSLLGYSLSIKNIFTIVMAHLNAYIELFKRCIDAINMNSSRTLDNCGLSSSNLPDISVGISGNSVLPSFPALKNSSNEFCYFDDISLGYSFEEDIFIKNLFVSTTDTLNQVNYTKLLEENINNNTSNYFIPTCISDFNTIFMSAYNFNPYNYIYDGIDTSEIEWPLFFFTMRCIQKYMMERGDDLSPEEFGKYEAYNLWLSQPLLHKEHPNFYQAITTGDYNDSKKYIELITSNEHCYSTSNDPLLTLEIAANGNEVFCIPVNKKYNMPASIGYGGGYKTYQDEYSNENTYSYNECLEEFSDINSNKFHEVKRPYGLIKEISIEKINEWNNNIKKLVNIPEGLSKHNDIISKYLENNKNLYLSNKNDDIFMYENPSWNITYILKNNVNFFVEYEDSLTKKMNGKIFTLNDNFTNENNLELFSINKNQIPLFIKDDLKPEDILTVIPHNLEVIVKNIIDGKSIVTLPYTTMLFFGYLISLLQKKYNNYNEFEEVFQNLLINTINAKTFYDLRKKRPELIRVSNSPDNANYAILLLKILLCLTSNKDDKTLAPNKVDYHYYYDKVWGDDIVNIMSNSPTAESVFFEIWEIKQKGYFIKDTFGFKKAFDDWCNSNDSGGFLYFKNNLSLKLKDEGSKIQIDENTTVTLSGDTINIRLSNFINTEESIREKLYHLSNENTKTPILASMSENNIFANIFTEPEKFRKIYQGIYIADELFYLVFNNENSYVKELNKFFTKTINLIIPYTLAYSQEAYNGTKRNDNSVQFDNRWQTLSCNKNKILDAYNAFKKTIKDLYDVSDSNLVQYTTNNVNYELTSNQKFAMYYTLKNLYDKHFVNIPNEMNKYDIKTDESELSRFYFINSWYKDIGQSLYINPTTLLSLIDTISEGYTSGKGEGFLHSEMSLYSFLSLICQKHNLLFIAVPIFNAGIDDSYGYDNFENMFKPLSYNESHSIKSLSGPCYICYYPGQPSQHLENKISQYENDGFMIKKDLNETSNFEGPTSIRELNEEDGGYVIPAFSVEYGSQKQSIFKNIMVNMDNPQVTEVAVANQFAIANNNSNNVRRLEMEGQDLFKIYSNYSYTCQVEMMGCAQIQPLMYFQLNNIPMFRGAYQIINVEHNITPGDMTTSFKGVRINKTQIPMANISYTINFESLINEISTHALNNKSLIDDIIHIKIDDSLSNNTKMEGDHNKSLVSAEDLLRIGKKDKNNSYVKFDAEYLKTSFNRLNPSLRQLIYCIASDLPTLSKEVNYDIGFYITSATRDNANNESYHRRLINSNSKGFTVNKRNNCEGLHLSDDGLSVSKEMVSYDFMGCAIDIVGTKNGEKDRTGASIVLFKYIAEKYNKYLKQLIWEVRDGLTTADKVDLIHIASLGELSPTNKGSIFAGQLNKNGNSNTQTYTIKESNRLPESYKRICENIPRTYVNVNVGS